MTPEQIAVQFEHDKQEIKSLKHRMDECEQQQTVLHKLVTTVEKLALNMDYMAKEQSKQGERLKKLECEPIEEHKYYKRMIIGCIITGVVGPLIGAVITMIIGG